LTHLILKRLSKKRSALGTPFYLILTAFIVAFNKAVTLDCLNSELYGNSYLNALGNNNAAGGAARLLLTFYAGLSAALGFNLAKVCFGADFNGQTNVKNLLSELVAVALLFVAVLFLFKGVAGVGVYVHFSCSFPVLV